MATMAPVKTENAAPTAAAKQAQPVMQVPTAGTVSGLVKSCNEGAQGFEPVAGADANREVQVRLDVKGQTPGGERSNSQTPTWFSSWGTPASRL